MANPSVADAVAQTSGTSSEFQSFLDNQQYTTKGILKYEFIFGSGWTSSGGPTTTKQILDTIKLPTNSYILDVGCGIGGGSQYLAKAFDASVLGIDLSENSIKIANERYQGEESRVKYQVADAVTVEFPRASFDLVYSRDSILHLDYSQKETFYRNALEWLKPDGQLLITDYCADRKDTWTDEFASYVSQRGYSLLTIEDYGALLSKCGFELIAAEDVTKWWIEVLQSEVESFQARELEFKAKFTESDYEDLVSSWKSKLERANNGIQKWGLFRAIKTSSPL